MENMLRSFAICAIYGKSFSINSMHNLPPKPSDLQELKILGHVLLDEYIALDPKRGEQSAKEHAYTKIENKLKVYGKSQSAHFGQMRTAAEVLTVIEILRRLIRKRKKSAHYFGREYDVYASKEAVSEEFSRLKNPPVKEEVIV